MYVLQCNVCHNIVQNAANAVKILMRVSIFCLLRTIDNNRDTESQINSYTYCKFSSNY